MRSKLHGLAMYNLEFKFLMGAAKPKFPSFLSSHSIEISRLKLVEFYPLKLVFGFECFSMFSVTFCKDYKLYAKF